jgi:hypothetical protein
METTMMKNRKTMTLAGMMGIITTMVEIMMEKQPMVEMVQMADQTMVVIMKQEDIVTAITHFGKNK